MVSDKDRIDEERANLHQRIGELEGLVARMEVAHTEDGLNAISLKCAEHVEDLFAQHHRGGRTQRLARMQLIIREAMRTNLSGKTDWTYPNSLHHITEPHHE